MDILEKIGDTIVHVGKDVTQKAKDVSGIAKLKLDIRAKEDFIKEQYMAIGKEYYERHKEEAVRDQARFDQIDEALNAIAKMQSQILELKGSRKCPECGAETTDSAEYCSVCGAKLSIVVDDVSYEEAEETDEAKDTDL